MNAMTSIPPEISDTIIATIIYFTATSVLLGRFWSRWKRRKKEARDAAQQIKDMKDKEEA
jgi:simple sugar transport system permease protein